MVHEPPRFERYIGIDYSGAATPVDRLKGLQAYEAAPSAEPVKVVTRAAPAGQHWKWCRQEIAEWLIQASNQGMPFVAGIDHAFSFPASYFQRYGLADWDAFLVDFRTHWPTDERNTYVDDLRADNPRTGGAAELRLTERWSSSAKSVFLFDCQGQVAKSTHAGIPWLHSIRQAVGQRVHFWPFDGWTIPQGKSAIVEVYPSILRKRFPAENRTPDEQDACCTARWLRDTDRGGFMDRYLNPPLTDEERAVAAWEGWILGIA